MSPADIVRLKLRTDDLSIEVDSSPGGDPYNCTGQHLMLTNRKRREGS